MILICKVCLPRTIRKKEQTSERMHALLIHPQLAYKCSKQCMQGKKLGCEPLIMQLQNGQANSGSS